MLRRSLWVVLATLVVGCNAGANGKTASSGSGGSGVAGTASNGTTGATMNTSATNGSTGSFMSGAASTGTGMQTAEVFGHSLDTLYKLDPITKAVSVVAPFTGCGASGVIDIALDKDSNLIATTFDGIYQVDRTNAMCQLIQYGSYPNSLAFIPAGTLDPNVEALVGYNSDQYVRIDPTTGNLTNIGTPWGNGLVSSGDIVSVKGGGTYLTVNGNNCGDCLVEVDPKTGAMTKNWGSLGYSEVYGIAFWAGSVYGFDYAGEIFEVTFNGGTMQTMLINAPPNVAFSGAGSTTSAPPTPQ